MWAKPWHNDGERDVLTETVTTHLRGGAFRLFVAYEGAFHVWGDLLLPTGEYRVEASIADDCVRAVSLWGPTTDEARVERENCEWVFAGSVLCFVDDAGLSDASLSETLKREATAIRSEGPCGKVVLLSASQAEVLFIGPTGWAWQSNWSVAWRSGGGVPSQVALEPWDA